MTLSRAITPLLTGSASFKECEFNSRATENPSASLAELDSNARLERAWLEPELISSVTGRERSKRKVIGFNDLPPHLVKAITVTEDQILLRALRSKHARNSTSAGTALRQLTQPLRLLARAGPASRNSSSRISCSRQRRHSGARLLKRTCRSFSRRA